MMLGRIMEQARRAAEHAARTKSAAPPPLRYPQGCDKGPLKSYFFSKFISGPARQRLQAAADQHGMHIVPKSRGQHVGWLHIALNIIYPMMPGYIPVPGGASEEASETYGPYLSAKVYHYKQICKLVNHDYQNTVDDIVGIMTMRTLDYHFCFVEQKYPESAFWLP